MARLKLFAHEISFRLRGFKISRHGANYSSREPNVPAIKVGTGIEASALARRTTRSVGSNDLSPEAPSNALAKTFTHLLQDNHAKCDRVIRTLFGGATVDLDDWEVLCRDRNAYCFSIPPEPNGGIDFLNCRELLVTNKMLLKKAGSKIKPKGCRIKSVERRSSH